LIVPSRGNLFSYTASSITYLVPRLPVSCSLCFLRCPVSFAAVEYFLLCHKMKKFIYCCFHHPFMLSLPLLCYVTAYFHQLPRPQPPSSSVHPAQACSHPLFCCSILFIPVENFTILPPDEEFSCCDSYHPLLLLLYLLCNIIYLGCDFACDIYTKV
jgi:hypothetical protein